MSRSYRRRVLGLSWWDDDGAVDVVTYTPGRIAALAEPPARCECLENRHVCRYCLARNAKWHNPLDFDPEADTPEDSGLTSFDIDAASGKEARYANDADFVPAGGAGSGAVGDGAAGRRRELHAAATPGDRDDLRGV